MGRLRKGVIGNIAQAGENITEIAKKVAIDRDAQIQIDGELQKIRAQLLLGGSGQSITKITICALVSLVVIVISYKFLIAPEAIEGAVGVAMKAAKDYAISVTPLIGVLIGVFGTKGGKTLLSGRGKRK